MIHNQSVTHNKGNAVYVYCRASTKTTPRTDPTDASLQSQLFLTQNSHQRNSSSGRDKLRQVLIELANSDAFIDLIVDKLQAKGLQL